jgi:H/ACA ribonucleoprotein complex subunit 1
VDEILGKIQEVYITIKMDPGVVSSSFQPDDVVYVGTDKLLPLARFTNPSSGGGGGRGGGGRGGGRYVLKVHSSFFTLSYKMSV